MLVPGWAIPNWFTGYEPFCMDGNWLERVVGERGAVLNCWPPVKEGCIVPPRGVVPYRGGDETRLLIP